MLRRRGAAAEPPQGASARCSWLLLAAALSSCCCCSASGQDAPGQAADLRGLQLPEDVLETPFKGDEYMHARYNFSLARHDQPRTGMGEVWLSFEDSLPRLRLRGYAKSPRFGKGQITLVADPKERILYAMFNLSGLHEEQCVKYPFPEVPEDSPKMQTLRHRRDQLRLWRESYTHSATPLPLQWTRSSTLEVVPSQDGRWIHGVKLRRGSRLVKVVWFAGGNREWLHGTPEEARSIFGAPAPNCKLNGTIKHPIAEVELASPLNTSSSLNDLLLLLSDSGRRSSKDEWPPLFILLLAITLPGDISVMIENPPPPSTKSLSALWFNYSARVFDSDPNHVSNGSIWMSLQARSLRLRGEAQHSLVGSLLMDVIASGNHLNPGGGSEGKVFTNVNLTSMEKHECVVYEYPQLSKASMKSLGEISRQKLTFLSVAELDGEACGIFVAPLTRDRWIHVWVDLDAEEQHAIVRTAVQKGSETLRVTDIRHWQTGPEMSFSIQPSNDWGCTPHVKSGSQLASLGLTRVHQRSIQLQDTLYALQSLDIDFAVLEVLALTGDVAIMVKEPEAPELWKWRDVNFTYAMNFAADDAWSQGFLGSFIASTLDNVASMDVSPSTEGPENVAVVVERDTIAVRVQDGGGAACLMLPWANQVNWAEDTDAEKKKRFKPEFSGVELVDDVECNRFTFRDTSGSGDTVEFWFSVEKQALCQLTVTPLLAEEGEAATILINKWSELETASKKQPDRKVPERRWEGATPDWKGKPRRSYKEAAIPPNWNCKEASAQQNPWLSLAPTPSVVPLPAGRALAKLAEAAGTVGLIHPRAATVLARLVIGSPSGMAPTPAPAPGAGLRPGYPPGSSSPQLGIFDPKLSTFSFSFTSNTSTRSSAQGHGEVFVDLVGRQFYLRSHGRNISAAIPTVETRILFKNSQQRLFVRNTMPMENKRDYEQCWSISTANVVLSQRSNSVNPFLLAKRKGNANIPIATGGFGRKWEYSLDYRKHVELVVDEQEALVGMNVEDLFRHTSSGVIVGNWTTAHIDDNWFNAGEEWNCDDTRIPTEVMEALPAWEMLRVFF